MLQWNYAIEFVGTVIWNVGCLPWNRQDQIVPNSFFPGGWHECNRSVNRAIGDCEIRFCRGAGFLVGNKLMPIQEVKESFGEFVRQLNSLMTMAKKVTSNRLSSRKRLSLRRFDWLSANAIFCVLLGGKPPKFLVLKKLSSAFDLLASNYSRDTFDSFPRLSRKRN